MTIQINTTPWCGKVEFFVSQPLKLKRVWQDWVTHYSILNKVFLNVRDVWQSFSSLWGCTWWIKIWPRVWCLIKETTLTTAHSLRLVPQIRYKQNLITAFHFISEMLPTLVRMKTSRRIWRRYTSQLFYSGWPGGLYDHYVYIEKYTREQIPLHSHGIEIMVNQVTSALRSSCISK